MLQTVVFKHILHCSEHEILAHAGPEYPVMHVLQAVVVAHRVQLATVLHIIFVQVAPEYPLLHVKHVVAFWHKAQLGLHTIFKQLTPE